MGTGGKEGQMNKQLKNAARIILTGIFTIALTACGNREVQNVAEKQRLVLATFDDGKYICEQVKKYNQESKDYYIEVRSYERSEEMEMDGILLLQREIATGKGPDIIDFGNGYTTSDIVGGYTENILDYLEEAERGNYLENILDAFCYGEKLYAIPLGFTLESFVGLSENLSGYQSWNIEEMINCYNGQERLLYPGEFKKDVWGTILTGSMEYYIDWETGQCNYDSEEFRKVLGFCNRFPEQLQIAEEFSVKQTFAEDKALLLPITLRTVYDICRVEHIFGEKEITFIGFPVESGNGTMIRSCGSVLAVSSASSHKEGAWAFISECLSERGQTELESGFPIRYSVLEKQIEQAMQVKYGNTEEGEKEPIVRQQILFEGEEPVGIYSITSSQAKQLLDCIRRAEKVSQVEPRIYNVFMEEAEYYFNGAKSLEETAKIIQARVSLYVNEKIVHGK